MPRDKKITSNKHYCCAFGQYVRRWGLLSLYTILIFVFLPVFPVIWNSLTAAYPQSMKLFSILIVPVCAAVLFLYIAFIERKKSFLFYFGFFVCISALAMLLLYSCEYSAEKLHLIEYTVLAFLTYRAFSLHITSPLVYLCVLGYCISVGYVDEAVQEMLPNRYYEFKDIALNWASSLIGTVMAVAFTWKRHMPSHHSRRFVQAAYIILIATAISQALYVIYRYRHPPLNVILLTVDSLRPDHFAAAGSSPDVTPFIDTLARKSIVFTNVISSAPWTCPGMISLFTGMYPDVHGVEKRGDSLLPRTETIFDAYRASGYRTPNLSYLTNLQNFANLGLETDRQIGIDAGSPGDELLQWISSHEGQRFCAWYHYRFLHLPYQADPECIKRIDPSYESMNNSTALKAVQNNTIIPANSISFTPDEKDAVIALYGCQLKRLDKYVKRLVRLLEKRGLARKTLFVIAADHGEELFDHGFIGHASTALNATLYDEVLKTPLLFYCPSRFDQGHIIERQVRQIDIMPTILELTGLPVPPAVEGQSLVPLIGNSRKPASLPALSSSVMGGFQSTPEQEQIFIRSIRTPEWKLICTHRNTALTDCRLYNLTADPGETADVAAHYPERAARLKNSLRRTIESLNRTRLSMIAGASHDIDFSAMAAGKDLAVPRIISPADGSTVNAARNDTITVSWTGNPGYMYVIEYDVGSGFKKVTGSIPVKGTKKIFGPLPREAWEPLPEWNPYRLRVSPFGDDAYWSDWTIFTIRHGS